MHRRQGEKVNSLRLNICFTERELLLVLDKRARQRAVRLLGEVRHEQGRPELHGQRGSLSEHLRDEGEHSIEQLLVVQGRRPRPGQLGLLLPSRPGPNLKQIAFKSIRSKFRYARLNIQSMGTRVLDSVLSRGKTTGGAPSPQGLFFCPVPLMGPLSPS